MSRRSTNRPRRIASPRKIRMLRLAGWRYSTSREAWVHRTFNGRVGPVFVDSDFEAHPGLTDLSLFDAPPARMPVLLVPEDERAPLPRRETTPPTPVTRVLARLADGEEARVVTVDGKPPQRGIEVPTPPVEAVVVPIKSARATG